MSFPETRMRRLRRSESMRALVRETGYRARRPDLPPVSLPRRGVRRAVGSMPGVFNLSVDEAVREAEEAAAWASAVCCSSACPSQGRARRRRVGRERHCAAGLRALKAFRASKKLVLIADVCLCEYTSHGHCGMIVEGRDGFEVDNDQPSSLLARTAVSQAKAGADMSSPPAT
jgi:porphobilinogen synthase